MFSYAPKWRLYRFRRNRKRDSARGSAVLCGMLLGLLLGAITAAGFFSSRGLFSSAILAQETDPATLVVVQPGAAGKPGRSLPPSTSATLPPRSDADVEVSECLVMQHP